MISIFNENHPKVIWLHPPGGCFTFTDVFAVGCGAVIGAAGGGAEWRDSVECETSSAGVAFTGADDTASMGPGLLETDAFEMESSPPRQIDVLPPGLWWILVEDLFLKN